MFTQGGPMTPRGQKSSYTDKQRRQAEHIEEGYEKRGVSKKKAEQIAYATVNKAHGGGKKSGSGRGKTTDKTPFTRGGKKGGVAAGKRTAAQRAASAKKAAATRKRNAAKSGGATTRKAPGRQSSRRS
jgi:plasmid stabilization system protein ParE